ncbi:N-acyl-D-amino-acid deacylase family protein [Sphingomonas cavernae]|uniref:D-aminoacylase n=1 Tax=Sphingomonas cavernae TaxID=2320861 RepID=A0A418WS11_9SPHN|nr:D-aminoacylase [Sphingomonas cavernae]RJF93976.1 D-aminoacylase [Sphingomonas cavernae]
MALRIRRMSASLLLAVLIGASAPAAPEYDLLIRGGTLYDGSGDAGVVGDIAVKGDRIVHLGGKAPGSAKQTIDAKGLAVAPGFINMLSWANDSLIEDGKAQSDIRQGVTLEVMGEGTSSGPLTPEMKKRAVERQGDIRYPITWTSLGEYLEFLTKKGVSPNVASFVGAATVRINVLGEGDVDPNADQLAQMRSIVRTAMREGAMGVGSSLIYAPASYAETPELIALTSEAARCGGMYISHMRSEGDRLIEAIDELIAISKASGAPAEIYHLKQAGQDNWGKLDAAIARIEAARADGLRITANMYPYAIAGTGLDASMPTWVQAGGVEAWIERLRDPQVRARVIAEMKAPGKGWENLYRAAGGAENLIVVGFKNPALKPLTGKTLAEVAKARGKSPEDTAIDLVIEDGSRVGTLYRLMSEDNVRRQIGLPWMSFGSDEEAAATEGVFLKYNNHPRAYGTFARVLGHYVRDQKAATLPDAIHRLTALPARNLGLKERGRLAAGNYADIVVFDPAKIADHATVSKPAQYATGMRHVVVNGVQVLKDGEHTGATPGRVVRGAGWTGWPGGGQCK